jgi:hypothetical protein
VVLPPAAACRFFQDKRVKVSLFLAEGIQQPSSGKLVAPSCLSDQVGLVRSFDDTGKLEREERLQVNSQKVCRQLAKTRHPRTRTKVVDNKPPCASCEEPHQHNRHPPPRYYVKTHPPILLLSATHRSRHSKRTDHA